VSTGPKNPDRARGAGGVPDRARGTIALLEASCTACMICARECPDWCIHVESTTEQPDRDDAGRSRTRARPVLQRFAIDFGACLFCGICIEVCPFDALHWSPEHDHPGVDAAGERAVAELVAERDVLGELVARVPPPLD
jgi:NADH-quinone oxidoreductase subunit I